MENEVEVVENNTTLESTSERAYYDYYEVVKELQTLNETSNKNYEELKKLNDSNMFIVFTIVLLIIYNFINSLIPKI